MLVSADCNHPFAGRYVDIINRTFENTTSTSKVCQTKRQKNKNGQKIALNRQSGPQQAPSGIRVSCERPTVNPLTRYPDCPQRPDIELASFKAQMSAKQLVHANREISSDLIAKPVAKSYSD